MDDSYRIYTFEVRVSGGHGVFNRIGKEQFAEKKKLSTSRQLGSPVPLGIDDAPYATGFSVDGIPDARLEGRLRKAMGLIGVDGPLWWYGDVPEEIRVSRGTLRIEARSRSAATVAFRFIEKYCNPYAIFGFSAR